MCNKCKINGMGKKKHRISGIGSAEAVDAAIIAVTVPIGIVGAQEGKNYLIPMLIKPEDTPEQKKTKALYAQGASAAVGLLSIGGGIMLHKKSREGAVALIGFGAGAIGQTLYTLWMQYGPGKNADGTGGNIAGPKWDAKAWYNAKQIAEAKARGINGNDNASAGIMGNDNASAGIMARLKVPLDTRIDEIGRKNFIGSYRRVGNCGL